MSLPSEPIDENAICEGYVLQNTVLHYSYLMSNCLGQGYSSKVFRGVDDRTGIVHP
jgi:hypothetical protein